MSTADKIVADALAHAHPVMSVHGVLKVEFAIRLVEIIDVMEDGKMVQVARIDHHGQIADMHIGQMLTIDRDFTF